MPQPKPGLTAALLLGAAALLPTAGAVTFTDARHGFSVTPPPGWAQTIPQGAAVLFSAPKAVLNFRPSINVLVQPLVQPLTQAQYHNRSLQNLGTFIPQGKVVGTGPLTFAGVKGNQTAYTGLSGENRMYYVSTYAVQGKNVYVITGATLKGSGSEAELKKVMGTFVKSFAFVK